MVRLLVLQQLYNLSDAGVPNAQSQQFRAVCGAASSSRVLDAEKVWDWRERLNLHDLIGDINATVSRQLMHTSNSAPGRGFADGY
jgi:hypothetical protein